MNSIKLTVSSILNKSLTARNSLNRFSDRTNRIPAVLPLGLLFIGLSQTGLGLWLLPSIVAYLQVKGKTKKSECFDWLPVFIALFKITQPWKKMVKQNSREEENIKQRLLPVMPCSVSDALLLFSLNRLHFTLPCILATAISACFPNGINHCRENVWELFAGCSVPRMSSVLCLDFFFPQDFFSINIIKPDAVIPFRCTRTTAYIYINLN